ncbi:MAG: tryptophan synthase subunit alpha, partial [Nanoarchaeota archaeon]|nr:tryptophan synthase subunit alpha [Nanoarchaeota archaeon]
IVASLQPDYVAIEPPELIGGKVSVVTRPELVKKGIEAVKSISKKTEVLVGAGVHSKEDVKKAIKLGAKGVFVASSICKAKDPEEKIRELAEGLK